MELFFEEEEEEEKENGREQRKHPLLELSINVSLRLDFYYSKCLILFEQRVPNKPTMNDDEHQQSQINSIETSRLSSYSKRYFDYFDLRHSVFSRNSYYDDMHNVHPWIRRPCSPFSGVPLVTLRTKSCSSRLEELARPKIKRERMIRQEFFDNVHNYAYSGVTTAALTAQCSDRLSALARPKKRVHRNHDSDQISKNGSERVHISKRTSDSAKSRTNIVLLNTEWKK